MKKTSLRIKFLFSVGCIVFLVLGASTLLHIRVVEQYYLEAITWRSEGLAQGILDRVEALKNYNPLYKKNVQVLLEKLSLQCKSLYELNKEKNIAYLAVYNAAGVVAAHNAEGLLNTSASADLLAKLARQQQVTVVDEGVYHTLIPIIDDGTYLGTIDIGVLQEFVNTRLRQLLINTAGLFVLFLILATVAISLLTHMIVVKPVNYLLKIGKKIAQGELTDIPGKSEIGTLLGRIKTHDEIGALNAVFRDMVAYLQQMAKVATDISNGDLRQKVVPKSEGDVLGTAFHAMTQYLDTMAQVTTQISQGNLRQQVKVRSEYDQLGTGLIQMQGGLINLISQIRSSADEIASISIDILDVSSKSSDALKQVGNTAEVTLQAMQQASSNTEDVRNRTERLTTIVEQTGSSIGEVVASIKHVANNTKGLSHVADKTLARVVDIMQSLEKIAATAEDSKAVSEITTRDARSGQDSVEQVVTRMTAISDVTEDIANIVLRLKSRSTEIGMILDVINEIAGQTSLLALNASIIAAQAGSHGRGFAVVADEIKQLATRVDTSTKEIATIVNAVQHDSLEAVNKIEQGQAEVKSGVDLAHNAGEALQKIRQSVKNSSEVAAEIATLIRQQATAHTHIAKSIQDVANMINEITRSTDEQEKKSSRLFIVIENMQELESQVSQVVKASEDQRHDAMEVTAMMNKVTRLVEENSQAVVQLTSTAKILERHADTLKHQIARFSISSPAVQTLTTELS